MSRLYVSLSAYGGTDIGSAFEALHLAGVSHIGLSVGAHPSHRQVDMLKDWHQDIGTRYQVHHNFPLSQKGIPRIDLCKGLDRRYFRELFALCRELSVTHYTLHPGMFDQSVETEVQAEARFYCNVEQLLDLAGDLVIGFETMYRTPRGEKRYLLDNQVAIQRYLAHPKLKLVADVAHLKIGIEQGTMTRKYAEDLLFDPRVIEFHVSDNDGWRDSHVPAADDAWFWDALKAAVAANPQAPIVLEGRLNGQGPEAIRREVERTRERLAA